MTDPVTPNKALDLPSSGEYPNTWDVPVNQNFTDIDAALGGTTSINVVAASGTVTLSRAQYLNANIVLAGTLSANVNYQFPSGVGGFWFVYNNTSASFTITFSSAGGGTTVTLSQGATTTVVCDRTNVRMAPLLTATTTWTPVVTFTTPGGLSVSYSAQYGAYVRFGSVVFAQFSIGFTPTYTGSTTGEFRITGLPFAATVILEGILSVHGSNLSYPLVGGYLSVSAGTSTSIRILNQGSNAGSTAVSTTNMPSGFPQQLTGWVLYLTA